MLAFCIFLSVLLIGAFAMMYFGPTVQDFLPEGGDTRKMAGLLMGATAVGCAIFTLYASMLFFRYKSREYGIFPGAGREEAEPGPDALPGTFLTCGIGFPRRSCSGGPGVLADLETVRTVPGLHGRDGLPVGDAGDLPSGRPSRLCPCALLLGTAGSRFVRRTDIMKILRTSHQPEMVKKIPAWTLPAGAVMVPLGILLALGIPQMSVYLLGKSAPSCHQSVLYPRGGGNLSDTSEYRGRRQERRTGNGSIRIWSQSA